MKAFLLVGLICINGISAITFENNGYKDVIVSIHPDVPEKDGQTIIDNIKDFVGKGSNELYYATEGYAYINSVTILLPKTWKGNYGGTTSSDYFYEDGNIRVNLPNSLYLDSPYTLQPGGCGQRGEYIHLTPNFLLHLNDTSPDYFGPLDHVFVHEWSKLRYGVFEEYGYPGDEKYPLFYYEEVNVDGGVVNELKPNFCTDADIKGSRIDIITGGACNFDPITNLPDEDCIFVPNGDNSQIKSSYMAAPFLQSVDHFCKDTEVVHHHERYIPTKHNDMCNYRSVWEVILDNVDFENVQAKNTSYPPDATQFKIIQPEDSGRFVLVLDRSGSMDDEDRIDRLKQSSTRWLEFDVETGTKIGIVSFSSSATVDKPLTAINDANKQAFIAAINGLKAKGGTCLGAGLLRGMDTLNGENDGISSGGAIIFITDGEFQCPGGIDIDNPDLLQRIRDSKVRIITVAFGTSSDERLENLAKISDGKTFFVKDGSGLEDINGVFEESNTYQPSVPSSDAEIIIVQDTFRDVTAAGLESSFIIDNSLGKDVKFTVDDFPGSGKITELSLYYPNGTVLYAFGEVTAKTVSHKFSKLITGVFTYKVKVTGKIDYILVTVTSKAADGEFLPYTTKCWAATDDGSDEIDATKTKLVVLAQVEQGNRPVLNAKVEALVEREGEGRAIEVDLFDKGAGADQIANDGIYSRYFSQYDGFQGRYTLRCQVKGDDDTMFVTQKNGAVELESTSRTYPLKPSGSSPVCCGSSIGDNFDSQPTGDFTRKANGNSFKVTNSGNPDEDILDPSKVSDLKASTTNTTIILEFTAPGDDLDEGKAASYDIRYSNEIKDLISSWNTVSQIKEQDLFDGSTLVPVNGTLKVRLEIKPEVFESEKLTYFAMKATDDASRTSPLSNIAQTVSVDYIPPGKVADLTATVVSAQQIDFGVVLEFTASGDDDFQGTADIFEVKVTDDEQFFTNTSLWNDISMIVKEENLIYGTLKPVTGGAKVWAMIDATLFDLEKTYYIALKVYDNKNLASQISNYQGFFIKDNKPPSAVTDLETVVSEDKSAISLTFVSPGDDDFLGTASKYEIKYSFNKTDVENWNNLADNMIQESDLLNGTLSPVPGHQPVSLLINSAKFEEGINYFMAMKVVDNVNNQSPLSNIANFEKVAAESGVSGGAIAGIVIGCLFLGAVLFVGAFFLWKRLH